MGLLDIFLPGNPVSPWLGQNRNSLVDSFAGMVGHGNDPRAVMKGAVTGLQHGRGTDEELMLAQQGHLNDQAAIEQERAQQDQTVEWLQQQGFEDLAEYARAGNGGEAWKLALERMNPETPQAGSFGLAPIFLKDDQGNQVIGQASSQGGVLINGQVMSSLPAGWSVTARPENFDQVDLGGSRAPFDPNTGTFGTGPAIQGAPSVNMDVTVGPDGRSMAPTPGSPQAIEQQGNLAGARARVQSLDEQSDVVVEHIDRALEQANFWTTGISGATSGMFPGSPAYDLRATVTTIKANIGFAELQEMRMNSPTGGALGQVAVQELEMLQAVLGSLDPNQSEDQLRQSLTQIAQLLERQKMYRQEALKERYGQSPQMPPQTNAGGWSVIGVE
jgi:hypothetical protein